VNTNCDAGPTLEVIVKDELVAPVSPEELAVKV
jgi:hypothetical protein